MQRLHLHRRSSPLSEAAYFRKANDALEPRFEPPIGTIDRRGDWVRKSGEPEEARNPFSQLHCFRGNWHKPHQMQFCQAAPEPTIDLEGQF